jgi:hypothetical protein
MPDQHLHRLGGRLQRQCPRAFLVHHGEASTGQLAEWCWPRLPAPERKHVLAMARAARSIGAVRVRRDGRGWLWRLRNTDDKVD